MVLLVALLHILGALTSIHAIMATRTAQGAIAWAVALNTFPYLTVPLYWVFGRGRFRGYARTRRRVERTLLRFSSEARAAAREYFVAHRDNHDRHQVLSRLAQMPSSHGNDVSLLIDGSATFESIFAGMERAQDYVLAQFFIVHDDELGRDFQRRLIETAQRGVRVYFLYDEIGSHALPRRYTRRLREAAVHAVPFHSTRGKGNRFQLNFRNHRKLVVVDGREGWVGGHNVGDEYVGRYARFGHWRDTHLHITGPAVLGLQLSFQEDWYWATREIPSLSWVARQSSSANRKVHIVPSSPADRHETATLMFIEAITSARHRVWAASPYFVPDEGIMSALKLAALRGCDVRILIPDRPDHLLVYLSGFTFVEELRWTTVRIYRYLDGFLHQKAMLIDDELAILGTANLDNRSLHLNFEISAVVTDQDFAGEVQAMFEKDFADSRLMDPGEFRARPAWFRFAARLARLMAPIQ